MVSSRREKNKKQLQLLGSITNSHHHAAENDSSMIMRDASKYIEELKHKVQLLMMNQDQNNNNIIAAATAGQTSSNSNWPVEVRVEGVEKKGIEVNLYSERSSPSLLVFVLKVFEELRLNLLDATISCNGTFNLQALIGLNVHQDNRENGESIKEDAQMVKQAILHAIQNWTENS